MAIIVHLKEFQGLRPRQSALALGVAEATIASNTKLRNGYLQPWGGVTYVSPDLGKSAAMIAATESTIFYYPPNTVWFHWDEDVDVAYGQLADDDTRVYYTDGTLPKMTYDSIAGAAGSSAPVTSYTLGVPAPSAALTATPNGSDGADEDDEDRYYVYTYVTGKGEEGPPSDPSNIVTINTATQTCDLSNFVASPGAGYNVTDQRIYRVNASTSGAEYQLVAERSTSASNYNDSKAASALGEVLASTYWDQPDASMQGIVAMPNEVLVGFFGRTLAFSEPQYPHAWPVSYEVLLDYNIIALGVFGETVVAATEGNPYLITGMHPANMSVTKVELDQACVSKRSMVDMGDYVIYASPDGLIMIGPGIARNVTESIFTRDEWQALTPTTITACKRDGQYIGFFDNGTAQSFIIDPDTEHSSFTYNTLHAIGCFNNLLTDTLYVHQDGTDEVRSWDTGSDLTYTWQSKKYRQDKPINPSAAQVFADTYPVTFKLYADGALKHTEAVANNNPFRLPGGYVGRDFQVQLTGTSVVHEVILAESLKELARV